MLIYEPAGKAREYSPLALNLYSGCSHQCVYCYCRRFCNDFPKAMKPKKDVVNTLERELAKKVPREQVLLSFVGDIYADGNTVTRPILNVLLRYQVPIAILTKNKKVLDDIDLFSQFEKIKIGFSLTFDDDADSRKYEPGASLPKERFEALRIIHSYKIQTFASLEPVFFPSQTLNIIDETHDFIDLYKVGKLNHYPEREKEIDWAGFGECVIEKLNRYGKNFYLKKDLANYVDCGKLKPENTNADYWALRREGPNLF